MQTALHRHAVVEVRLTAAMLMIAYLVLTDLKILEEHSSGRLASLAA
jgi:hypothetical protein